MNENLEKLIKEAATVLTIIKVVLILWIINWFFTIVSMGSMLWRLPLQ